MRRRFNPCNLLPVKARPNQRIVQVGKSHYLFDKIRRRYIQDKDAEEKIREKLGRVIMRRYKEAISSFKNDINTILGDVYVVIPHYPECSITDIMMIIKQLHNEPSDIIAIEICKKLDL